MVIRELTTQMQSPPTNLKLQLKCPVTTQTVSVLIVSCLNMNAPKLTNTNRTVAAPENENENQDGNTRPTLDCGSNIQQLASSIEKMLSQRIPKISEDYTIFRVPTELREKNDNSYSPQLVSIGPLHRGKPELMAMEEQKLRFLKTFLRRTNMSTESCLTLIWGLDKAVRRCYGETIRLSHDEFAKMILLDSVFIIESLIRHHFVQREQGSFHYLRLDLMLLENQLPFFILESIFNLAFTNYPLNRARVQFPPLLELSVKYLRTALLISNIPDTPGFISSCGGVKHFVDLLKMIHTPLSLRSTPRAHQGYIGVYSAKALQESGMKFKCAGPDKSFLEMTFTNRVLEIPRFRINDCTETLLRNVIALELRLYRKNSYILDCVLFMDGLINSAGDVGILVNNGVVDNYLGEAQLVANIFNGLTTRTSYWNNIYYFWDTSRDMNSYYNNHWNIFKALLNQCLSSSPVTAFTCLALVLTFFILNVKDPKADYDLFWVVFYSSLTILLCCQICIRT